MALATSYNTMVGETARSCIRRYDHTSNCTIVHHTVRPYILQAVCCV